MQRQSFYLIYININILLGQFEHLYWVAGVVSVTKTREWVGLRPENSYGDSVMLVRHINI